MTETAVRQSSWKDRIGLFGVVIFLTLLLAIPFGWSVFLLGIVTMGLSDLSQASETMWCVSLMPGFVCQEFFLGLKPENPFWMSLFFGLPYSLLFSVFVVCFARFIRLLRQRNHPIHG